MASLFQRIGQAESQVAKLTGEMERLQLENSVFQRFYEKKSMELGADEDNKSKKKKNKVVVAKLLTVEQRVDVANVVHEDLLGEIESNRKNAEKMIDTLRAVLEETEIRIGELKRDAYEFKREVVVGAENARTGKIMAERVARYFEDKLKQVDAVIEKLRLKNSTLKSQINKIELQLAQKEEVGDSLHYIDFHQLQIENKQYVLKIEERNEELLHVKLSAGKTIQVLNEYKKRLKDKLDEAEWLKNEVTSKKSLLSKLEKEDGRVTKDFKTEKKSRNRLVQQIEEAAAMPNIEDYIQQKREMYDLQATLANWQKKVEIMEMAAKKARSIKA
jgi:chromosome segregation ATPase